MNRRQFFHGRTGPITRPPWTIAETGFTETCDRCGECISACPEQIIVRGSGGFPEMNFRQGECTFCAQCANTCKTAAFIPAENIPWTQFPATASHCLAAQGMTCFSCSESCDAGAINFSPGLLPIINTESCTGCGACVRPCPVNAITIKPTTPRISPAMEVCA